MFNRTCAWACAVVISMAGNLSAQVVSAPQEFELLREIPADVAAGRPNIRPDAGQVARVKWEVLEATLSTAPREDVGGRPVILALPRPDGGWDEFAVVDSPVMEAGLAAAFPDIRTFAGQGVTDPSSTVRLDWTMHGFHAQVFTTDGSYYIDPVSFGDREIVTSYWKRDLRRPIGGWTCMTPDDGAAAAPEPGYQDRAIVTRRQYRLAVSATVEYTAFHGGTQAAGQAAIVTAVNRVNQVYERDLATRFILVANNQSLVYVGTDNYQNNGGTADLDACQANCNSVIGTANYDVGHLFQTGNGGVVGQIGAFCNAAQMGRGLSGLPSPVNDPFVVDYVCHELGHQAGGRHCFNNCNGGAGDAQTHAFEPGSGVTIMAYAGICGPTDLQPNSDAMFHSGSLTLMANFLGGTACDVETVTTNNTPVVDGGPDYVIPRQTPFILTATGSDPDGDALTYSWEQRNTTTGPVAVNTDNGTNPIIRTWLPTASPTRMVPGLSNLLANNNAFGEILPQVARTLNFRVVARDNVSGAGGTATDDVILTVASAGPFAVTAPNTNVLWSGNRTVTWSVNSTNVAPVSCANVRILLSTDGGNTFSTVLAESTPNDGSETISLPSITTSQARIKVEAIDNIFFDISNANFSIEPFIPAVALGGAGTNVASDAALNGNANGFIEPGESSIAVTVAVRNSGDLAATGVTGTLTSLTPTVSVVTGTGSYGTLVPGATANNTSPFVISVSTAHPCGELINLRLAISAAEGSGTYTFSLPTGRTTSITESVISFTGPAVAIPDNNTTGVTRTLTFGGAAGPITDLNVRFDGATCSATAGATGVGLTHSWVGDLVITLTAPGGSPSAVIVDRPGFTGSGFGSSANNFCQTVLDDEAAAELETAPATSAPFSGSFRPNNPLSVFDGISPVGQWTLRVADVAAGETGTLRAFSLIITRGQLTCDPPAPACVGDFNGDGSTDGDDVIAFFSAWDAGTATADVNRDDSVDGDDVIVFFAAWDAGC